MTKKVLYLGIDPARFQSKEEVFHYPVIRTEPIARVDAKVEEDWSLFTHVLFTSPSAVRHWLKLKAGSFKGKEILAIGAATAGILRCEGFESKVAPFATQEGVIALLEGLAVGYLFWPRSSGARNCLQMYLESRRIPYRAFDLYQTVSQRLDPVPDLSEFEEIVFTSPSTVKAFLNIYGHLPPEKKWVAIGPITKKALDDAIVCC